MLRPGGWTLRSWISLTIVYMFFGQPRMASPLSDLGGFTECAGAGMLESVVLNLTDNRSHVFAQLRMASPLSDFEGCKECAGAGMLGSVV